MPIKVAVVGVGNFCSALIQGLQYYKDAKENENALGFPNVTLGNYRASDIEMVAAFDIDTRKVGKDLSEAIFSEPNNVPKFAEIPELNTKVQKCDSLGSTEGALAETIQVDDSAPVNVKDVLRTSGAEIIINLLPSVAEKASKWWAQTAIETKRAFINPTPILIASDPYWSEQFYSAGCIVAGDDLMNQIGSTVLHKALINLFVQRGVHIDESYQLDIGGGSESLAAIDEKGYTKKRSVKTESVSSSVPYEVPLVAGSTDFVDFMKDIRASYFWIKGKCFAGQPVTVDIRLTLPDASAGVSVLLDIIRGVKIALDRNMSGALVEVSAYGFKHPPMHMGITTAYQRFFNFVSEQESERT
ncbi:MAG: inositol-3-phosphate synthase [Promethearchaeota archaeon]